jgi:hypothetical protein
MWMIRCVEIVDATGGFLVQNRVEVVNIGRGGIEGDVGGSEERGVSSIIICSRASFIGELVLNFLRAKA